MTEGLNENGRDSIVTDYQGGDIHLCSSNLSDGDGGSALSSASETVESTADGDWSITVDSGVGETTLELAADIDFGDPGNFVLEAIVLESSVDGDEFIFDNSPQGDTDLTGDGTFTLEAGNFTYDLGGE